MRCRRGGRPLLAIGAAAIVCGAAAPRLVAQQDDVAALDLTPGKTIERALAAGATDRFGLPLATGQAIDLVITNADSATVSLLGPSGTERVRVVRETSPDGAKRISDVADESGTHVLVVSLAAKDRAVRYQLHVTRAAAATEEDRARADALRAFAEAERLTLQRSASGYQAAVAPYRRAAERWHDSNDRAEEAAAWFRLGYAYGSASRYREGIDAYARAAAIRHDIGDQRGEGTALNNIASEHFGLAEFTEAQRDYERALALRRATGDRNGEAFTLSGLGTVSQSNGDLEKAATYYHEATALWRAAGNRSGESTGLHNLGSVYRALGRFQEALDFYTQALEIRRAIGDTPGIATTLTQIGNLRVTLGTPDQALDAYREALPLRRATGGRRGEAYTLSAMGTALGDRGDWTDAFAHLSQARDIFREIGDREGEGQALLSTGRTWLKQGDARRALEPLLQSRQVYEAIASKRSIPFVDVALGEAYTQLGKNEAAADSYRSAADALENAGDRNAQLTALVGLASVEQRLDQLADARAHAATAVGLLESLRSDVPTEQLRTSYLAARHGAYGLYIDVEMQLHAREPFRGHLEAAFLASERARARGLLDVLADAQLPSQAPQFAALTPKGLTIGGIRRLLGRDTLLLEYALGDERSYLWALTMDRFEGFTLPSRARVSAAARRAYALLARGAHRETQRQTELALESLGRLILAPVPAAMRRPRIVVVADGALQYVPFAALPDTGEDGPARPLIVRHEIVSLPSVATIDAVRNVRRNPIDPSHKIAVFADPVLRADDPRVARAAARSAGPRPQPEIDAARSARESGRATLERLPFARAEADAILAMAPHEQTLQAVGFDASRENALAEAGRYRVLHFATHALLNSQHPERSGILLSMVDRSGAPVDGFLRLQDVYNLRLNADLVVLSACRTALGKEVRGEGLVGLTRGFLHAGAPSVIASLWDVRDRSTAELMSRMYTAMLRDHILPPSAALRAAQASMASDPRWSAPAHWSGFVLQGDWEMLPRR